MIKLLTADEIARDLRCTVRAVNRLAAEGLLAGRNLSMSTDRPDWRFTPEAVNQWFVEAALDARLAAETRRAETGSATAPVSPAPIPDPFHRDRPSREVPRRRPFAPLQFQELPEDGAA